MPGIPYIVQDLLIETRFGISFPCNTGCQMRFIHEGEDLGGFYAYSKFGGIREAVKTAISDNRDLRAEYRCRSDGKRAYRFQRQPYGTTGFVGVSCGPYYDPRRDIEAFRYQVHWRRNSQQRSKTFHLSVGATPDQHLHAFRTAIQFRKEWECFLDDFDPGRYTLWRSYRLYEPGQPVLPDSFWETESKGESVAA